MAIKNTTNVIDDSIFLKNRLSKNMVGDNYYIENLQDRRNRDWYYRYNVVNIEEELAKPIKYTNSPLKFNPIEAVISNVKGPKGEALGDDWACLAFKDLAHSCGVGYKYRFDLNFGRNNLLNMTEEEKLYNSSIWIGINKASIKAGNSCVVRRCNTSLAFRGEDSTHPDVISEIHYEPCIIENTLKYMEFYLNKTLPIPQSERFVIMQLNYFTKCIQINDRFILNLTDLENRKNNQVYKVKSVFKSETTTTFVEDNEDAISKTNLVIVALDQDIIGPDDDIVTRVAMSAPKYYIDTVYPTSDNFSLRISEPFIDRILLKEEETYTVNIYQNEELYMGAQFEYEVSLENHTEEDAPNYYIFSSKDNTFTIKNIRPCDSRLIVKVSWVNPPMGIEPITTTYEIELGGFY